MELAIRCFIDSLLKSKETGIDEFDNTRILESAFNRLFLSVEHLTNAVILKEKGNYSKKHFGDYNKLKEFKERYNIDLAENYQTTYNFRAYADYRKFPEIKSKFDKKHLNEQINKVKEVFQSCLEIFKGDNTFKETLEIFKRKIS